MWASQSAKCSVSGRRARGVLAAADMEQMRTGSGWSLSRVSLCLPQWDSIWPCTAFIPTPSPTRPLFWKLLPCPHTCHQTGASQCPDLLSLRVPLLLHPGPGFSGGLSSTDVHFHTAPVALGLEVGWVPSGSLCPLPDHFPVTLKAPSFHSCSQNRNPPPSRLLSSSRPGQSPLILGGFSCW